jgi:hypothetical protein
MTKDDIVKKASKASNDSKKVGGDKGLTTFKVEQIKSGLDKFGPIRTLNYYEIERGEDSPYSQRNRMTRIPTTNIVIVPVAFKGEVYHFKVTFKSIGETDSYNIPRDMDESIIVINKHLTK